MIDRLATITLGIMLLAGSAGLWVLLLGPKEPPSTEIVFVDGPAPPPADPARLPAAPSTGPTATIGFVGDIMQHRNQMKDDFRLSYAAAAESLRRFDLLVGNLEFPVDPQRPVGPPPGSVQFNGSPEHLDALAEAGFDLLSLANNHAFDQEADGLQRTIAEIEKRGMTVLGSASRLDGLLPVVREINGIRVGFQGFTFAPNALADGDRPERLVMTWPPRDLPLLELNFRDWQGVWREEGIAVFRDQVRAARSAGAEFLVAFVHWGEEWHLAPSDDQRRAARDMIEAGYDLVVGSHPHVLQGSELVDGRLVAYSLGNFISDFVPLKTRTGALLSVTLGRGEDGDVRVIDFAFLPVLVDRQSGHRLRVVTDPTTPEEAEASALVRRLFGPGAAARQAADRQS